MYIFSVPIIGIEAAENQVWISNSSAFRAIYWWAMTFYIRRKTNFFSGDPVPIYSQKMNGTGFCV